MNGKIKGTSSKAVLFRNEYREKEGISNARGELFSDMEI